MQNIYMSFVNKHIVKVTLVCTLYCLSQIGPANAQITDSPFQNDRTKVTVGTEHFSDCNPILPLWEHIPDGEPHVFEDPDKAGKFRLYLYGSHDTQKNEFCGTDLVVWSAPLEDLSNWRYDGIIYANNNYPEDPRMMFAPDVAEITKNGIKRYYLYPNEQRIKKADVAIAESPKGPFVGMNKEGLLWADPAVLVDDDGRVYGYWGYQKSMAAELDPQTMCTLKPGTKVIENMVSSRSDDNAYEATVEVQSKRFRFFEASSIRKIGHMYVFIYSRTPHKVEKRGHTLAYAYSTNPLGPWTYGGPIITSGSIDNTFPKGNIHGSIIQLNGEWYVFYHRMTNNSFFARQACVEPINIQIKGNTVKIDEVPYTSLGFNRKGLSPYKKYAASIACHLTGNAIIKATYDTSINCNPIVNVKNNDVLGYKYYNFDEIEGKTNQIQVDLIPKDIDFSIDIMADHPSEANGGIKLGTIKIPVQSRKVLRSFKARMYNIEKLKGKRAVYLIFKAATDEEMCEMYYIKFNK